ncbi:MAG: hypothetical protein QOI01_1311 [Mycobacterium sp.]|jgi:hypothetical protein|nr:hypothetical protein [Mycobacterium sp.]
MSSSTTKAFCAPTTGCGFGRWQALRLHYRLDRTST